MHRWSQIPAVWAGSTAVTSGGTPGPKAGVRACGELGKPSGLPFWRLPGVQRAILALPAGRPVPWRPQGASAAFLGRCSQPRRLRGSWCRSKASRSCPR